MRRSLLPTTLFGLMATTVGCAQQPLSMPTPQAPTHDTYGGSNVMQVQAADVGQRLGSTSPRARSATTTRRWAHGAKGAVKHKFLIFKGIYAEIDPVASAMGKSKMATTTRRGARAMTTMRRRSSATTTRRRGGTTTRRRGMHRSWSWMHM